MMTLSIITINKNNAAGLERTCQSVVCQTFENFEWIVIDGASNDTSVDIINKYAYKMAYWISEPDTGIYNAMNKGIRKAQGEYCLFLNSGDWLISSSTLESVFNEINSTFPADIYFSDLVKSDGTVNHYSKNITINDLLDGPISHQNSLIRRSLFVEHGYYNENLRISSDWEFFLKESWKYKTKFSHIETNISIFDVHGIGSQVSLERTNEDMTIFQNVFHELTDTIIEIRNYHRAIYYDIIKNYGNIHFFTFIVRIYKFLIIIINKIIFFPRKIINKISFPLRWSKEKICYLSEMFTSIFDKSIRICFTNFRDIPHDFFMIPARMTLEKNHKKYKTVKYYNPHIHFYSCFGNKKNIYNSKSLCKIFFTGENTNVYYKEHKGNCIDNVSLSFGFDYITADNYFRFPLWLLYFFSPCNTKEDIKNILNSFKKPYQKTKFCSLVASHDRSGIRTKIYNDVSRVSSINCPGSLLHNDNTLRNRYADNKALYLQQFKFNICPENSTSPGYVTEKLFQSLYSGCIPIYNGWSKDPEPDIINPNIILWYDSLDNEHNSNLLNEIYKLNSDEKFFSAFIEQPIFCNFAVDKIYMMLQQFTVKINDTVHSTLKPIMDT